MSADYTPSPECLEPAKRVPFSELMVRHLTDDASVMEAARRERGAAYWRERFALKEAQPEAPQELKPLRVAKPRPIRAVTNIKPPAQPKEQKRCADCKTAISKKSTRCNKCTAKTRIKPEVPKARTCLDCPNPPISAFSPRCAECRAKHRVAKKKQHNAAHRPKEGVRLSLARYDLGAIARALRTKRGALSVAKIASEVGVSRSLLAAFESQGKHMTLPRVEKLCAWLGVPPEQFLRQREAA